MMDKGKRSFRRLYLYVQAANLQNTLRFFSQWSHSFSKRRLTKPIRQSFAQ
jgi:hypothetical protein